MKEQDQIYYDYIARDYHLKRKYPWKPFLKFIKEYIGNERFRSINTGIVIDLGCANGRHFDTINSEFNKLLGIDSSLEFLSIAKKNHQITNSQRIHLCCADMNHLPLRKDSVDLVVSIATLHHTPGKLNRKQLMHDLSQILQENGFLLFSVWKRWQKKFFKYFLKDKIKRLFSSKYRKKQKRLGLHEFGDKLVPWTVSRKNETYNRFYHLFTKRETKELCKPFTIMEFEAMGGPTNKDNFFVLCQI